MLARLQIRAMVTLFCGVLAVMPWWVKHSAQTHTFIGQCGTQVTQRHYNHQPCAVTAALISCLAAIDFFCFPLRVHLSMCANVMVILCACRAGCEADTLHSTKSVNA